MGILSREVGTDVASASEDVGVSAVAGRLCHSEHQHQRKEGDPEHVL